MSFSLAAKFLFKVFAFHNTTVLLLYETTINIIICSFIILRKRRKSISYIRILLQEKAKQIKQTIPFTIAYGTSVFCGMKALSLINIPLFLALRRTLIFFVFGFELLFKRQDALKSMNIANILSIILITLGALIAGYEHISNDIYGYILVICNNILSALGLHIAKILNQQNQVGPLELVFSNSLNLWPILLFLSLLTQDIQSFMSFESLYRTEFLVSITLVALIGFCLNLATSNCTMKNSPFAIALTHNVKDIVSTAISIILFDDQISRYLLSGIGLSFVGSFIYSYTKLKSIQREKQTHIELPTTQKD